MARFVTRHGNAALTAREEIKEDFATGKSRIVQRALYVQFGSDGLTDHDYEVARTNLTFLGLPEDREKGGEADPRPRMGVFDSALAQATNGWTDEEAEIVVDFLRAHEWMGRGYVEVEALRLPRPWPRYDVTPAEAIVQTAEAIGVPLEDVLAYERENQEREEVCRLLAGELSVREPEEVIVSA